MSKKGRIGRGTALLVVGSALAAWGAAVRCDDAMFAYDSSRPLELRTADVALRNIAYAGADGAPAEATVVAPSGPGRHPGVLFVHWYEEAAQNADRTQFLPDALALARRGVASLLIDTPWSEPKWFATRNPADDRAMSLREIRELRRSLDVMAALGEVDAGRIAFVGHDFGAMYGAVMTAVDRRPKALVFIAGTTSFSDWFLLGRKLEPDARRKVQDELAPLDPVRHLPAVAVPVLFQFAQKDPYVSREAADALVAAAREPKEVRFYECGHEMDRDAARDRVDWLARVLTADAGKPSASP